MDNQKAVYGGRDKGRDGLTNLALIRRKSRRIIAASFATAACLSGITLFSPSAQASTEPGLVGKRIVIDAGHGGRDGGAESADGRKEKDTTLAVANDLAALLRQSGAQVYLTRDTDTDLTQPSDLGHRQHASLRARTVYTKEKRPDVFISIHCNGSPSPTWRGAHVIYRDGNEEAKALATVMQENFRAYLLPTKRTIDDTSTLYLLRRIEGPAVLAEIGFMTNPQESAAMQTPAYRQRVAFVMYKSVVEYFGQVENSKDEPTAALP
ncbi:N-acetylmuramoyl-L-alanine amidase family protein [Alicyclobacillus sp. ALC3]|uniref:N-acetylmuramoyl-L-alanine amidase family protein n=1 Tax=Alicyclobacillus sp. ALC3 TaxID=2796143 RepID=UPI002378BD2B|nr:N-acetylmuramoyl-L-alanine amidase [Alicyclobacillus sp. ALC3]WDL98909.1 N-acetylmuramoyl-L-alanine amidase [Alicyclobacillus sp. ALC3]